MLYYWIPLVLLGVYLPLIALTVIQPLRLSTQLLKQLHLGSWVILLVLFIGFISLNISPRGQWTELILAGITWLSGAAYALCLPSQTRWFTWFYFKVWLAYPAILAGAFLLDAIFFVLVSIPVQALVPQPQSHSTSVGALRGVGGLLAPPQLSLVTPWGLLFELHRGSTQVEPIILTNLNQFDSLRILPYSPPDTIVVWLSRKGHQDTLRFIKL